jgi:hypothetical protein
MAFDDATRGRLQRFVGAARVMLTEEFARQLQQDYGLDPSTGDVAALDSLGHLDDRRLETARILREVLSHYLAADGATGADDRRTVLDRIVREQAFTILNRLAALRMMEARGIDRVRREGLSVAGFPALSARRQRRSRRYRRGLPLLPVQRLRHFCR